MIVNRLTIRELAEGTPQPPAPSPTELSAAEQRRLLALAALAEPEAAPEPEDDSMPDEEAIDDGPA